MTEAATRAAVFLDRDGCLNEDWFNPATGAWESPMSPGDLILRPGVVDGLRRLQGAGLPLVLVSNQPSFAKGKCSLADLEAVHARFLALLEPARVRFLDCCYCHHHPDAVMPGYGGACSCRKPAPGFLHRSAERYALALSGSWMIGDRDTDIACGKRAGTRTIQIANPRAGDHAGKAAPDHRARDFAAAVAIICDGV